MKYIVNTLLDLDFALNYVKPYDKMMVPKAMFEVNVYRIKEAALRINCVDLSQEWPFIYTGKDTRGVEIQFVPNEK